MPGRGPDRDASLESNDAIPPDEAALFHQVYPSQGRMYGVFDRTTFDAASVEAQALVRDAMLDNLPLLDSYAQQNPDGFDGDVIAQVKEWRHLVHGRFVIERDLKSYTVFLGGDREPTAYGAELALLRSRF